MPIVSVPDDIQLDGAPSPAGNSNNNGYKIVSVPDDIPLDTPMAPAPSRQKIGHPVSKPNGDNYADAFNFIRTFLTNAAGDFAGLPRAIDDAGDWLAAKTGIGKPSSASPFHHAGPTTEQAKDFAFNHTAPEYKPESTLGQYAMTGAEFAAPALLSPQTAVPDAARGFIAGLAAEGATRNGLPGWMGPAGTLLAEFLARRGAAVVSPHTAAGQGEKAGTVLNETTRAPIPATARPALPGMQVTVGQMTDDPGLLALDRNMTGANAAQQQLAADALTGNQAVIRSHLDKIAGGPGGVDASLAQSSAINYAEQVADQAQKTAWGKVNNATFDTTGLKQKVQDYVDNVSPAMRPYLPKTEIEGLLALPDAAPLGHLQDFRSVLGDASSSAARGGQKQASRTIGGVGDILETHLNDAKNLTAGAASDIADYNAARQSTAEYYSRFGSKFDQNPLAAGVTSGKVDASRSLQMALPRGAGGPEGLGRLKTAVGTGKGLDPARDYVIDNLKAAANEGADAFERVAADYGYALRDRDLFTPAQQVAINDAREAVRQTYRSATPGAKTSSKTYAGLTGNNFARTLYGNIIGRVYPAATKLAGTWLGAKTAGAVGEPWAEELIGPMMGKEAAEHGTKSSMESARDGIIDVLNQARRDPTLARELQRKASAGNLKLSPRLRAMLRSLGYSEAMALPGASGE